ncbi:T9SS type A sorting domain-containing protein, partial [Balneolaceae bacterium ANBcel3]|nr:T9SS type A sorting domain-containing protein [Balneolaceae bacterium ANBcel3]
SRIPEISGDKVEIGVNHVIDISTAVSFDMLDYVLVHSTGTLRVLSGGELTVDQFVIEGAGSVEVLDGALLRMGAPEGITSNAGSGNIQTSGRSFSTQASYAYIGSVSQQTGDGLPAAVQNLTIDNAQAVTLTSGLQVNGTLNLVNGTFRVSSGTSLIADTRTVSGGSLVYLRDITGGKGWRVMSSPVNTNFADFLTGDNGGFISQGFSGADYPDEQPNILYFTEDTVGDTVTTNMNWYSISSLSESVETGKGYFIYVFDGASGPGSVPARADELPFTLSVSGSEPSVASNTDFNISYTARQIYTDDEGWTLVGNPYGAAIDWDDTTNWVRTDMHQTIYIWDPLAGGASGAYLEWNGVTGSLGTGKIAPFQAFWVKAEESGAGLQVSPAARTVDQGEFRGKIVSGHDDTPAEMFLRAEHTSTGMYGEARMMFSEDGQTGKDAYDAYRLVPLSDSFLTMFSLRDDRMPLAINHLPARPENELRIPLEVYGAIHGMGMHGRVTLTWEMPHEVSDHFAVLLEDTKTGLTMDMRSKRSYEFELSSSNTPFFNQIASQTAGKVSGSGRIEDPVLQVNQPGNPLMINKRASGTDTRFIVRLVQRELSPRMGEFVPEEVELHQNYPNPFNPATTIRFALPEDQHVTLSVYDVLGRRVAMPADNMYSRGPHEIQWDAGQLSSGTYIYRLQAGDRVLHRKMMLVK